MRVLFAFGNGHTPEFTGGVQSNTDFLIRSLAERGHDSSLLCSLFGQGLFGLRARVGMKLSGRPWAEDGALGYAVRRAWNPAVAVPQLVKEWRPDVAVVQCHKTVPIGLELQTAGVPLLVYFHNVEFDELGGDPRALGSATFVANSAFTRQRYADVFGIDSHVFQPTLNPAAYATTSSGRYVTFVNPVEKKGLGLATDIARLCPEVPFLFIESWTRSPDQIALFDRLAADLPNITFRSRTADMRSVYGETKLLLVPSRWEETWGRVVSEAHCSGIPALATDIGGLPEAVGPGGMLFAKEAPAEEWAAAVRTLWTDSDAYRQASANALQYGKRPELDAAHQLGQLEGLLRDAAGRAAVNVPMARAAAG